MPKTRWDDDMGEDEVIELVIDGSSGDANLEKKLALIMQEYFAIWKTKQRKYGATNIAEMGKPGLVIRSNDKQKRLIRFVLDGIEEDDEGGEEDAWFDKAGYALIGVMVNRGWWPECPPNQITIKQLQFVFNQYMAQQSTT